MKTQKFIPRFSDNELLAIHSIIGVELGNMERVIKMTGNKKILEIEKDLKNADKKICLAIPRLPSYEDFKKHEARI